ncbi:MAG: D-glucuronyl C5-epimerase family protein, partial [Chloroflexota bacterium]
NNVYKKAFFAQADWLVKNKRVAVDGEALWEIDYNFTPFNLDIPWVSAMAQGQIISVLLRAYQLTADMGYYNDAEKALKAFRFPTVRGGVTWTDERGYAFYEEYPSQPPCHVLNGHIWAMLGLYDFYRVADSQEALELFDAGVATMKKYLPYYDTGYWSKHDLLRQPGYTAIRYHHYHIELLKVLHEITGDNLFGDYVQRWSSYLKPWRKASFAFRLARLRLRQYIGSRMGSA